MKLTALLLSLAVIGLTGCGFQLRNGNHSDTTQPNKNHNVSIVLPSRSAYHFQSTLESHFPNNTAKHTLNITNIDESERILSFTASMAPRLVRLQSRIDYQFIMQEQNPKVGSLSAYRDLQFSAQSPAAMAQERQLLRSQMADELAKRLVSLAYSQSTTQ